MLLGLFSGSSKQWVFIESCSQVTAWSQALQSYRWSEIHGGTCINPYWDSWFYPAAAGLAHSAALSPAQPPNTHGKTEVSVRLMKRISCIPDTSTALQHSQDYPSFSLPGERQPQTVSIHHQEKWQILPSAAACEPALLQAGPAGTLTPYCSLEWIRGWSWFSRDTPGRGSQSV